MTTETTEMDTLYDFSEDAVPPPPPPDPFVPTEPPAPVQVQTADIVALDLMRTSKFTIIIQLFPFDDAAARPCLIGVQLDKQAPTIVDIRVNELGVLVAKAWQLMEVQAQIAATTTKKKPAPAPAASKPAPVQQATSKPPAAPPKPAPVASTPAPVATPKAQEPQDDIYSLFDL